MPRPRWVMISAPVLAAILLAAKPAPSARIPNVHFQVGAHLVAPTDEDRAVYIVWHLECGDGHCNLSFAQISDCNEILVGAFTTDSTVLSVARSDDGKALVAQVRALGPATIVLRFEVQGDKLIGFSGSQIFSDGKAVTFVPLRRGEGDVHLSCPIALPTLQ